MEDDPPFPTLISAINYYLLKNPARQKFFNPAEPEFNTVVLQDFTGSSPRDKWASLAQGVGKVLSTLDEDSYWIFTYRYLYPKNIDTSIQSISELLRISAYKVRQKLYRVEDLLKAEFVRRELLAPEIN